MKIMVAMSGGVDSSVIAHLLKEQGHELVGVMMKLWTDPLTPDVRRVLASKCCSIEHIQRARAVCHSLDIPFYVLNLDDEFKKQVVDPFLQEYREGKTPNPCVGCNRTIKFGILLEKAEELGCDAIATGHYVRILPENSEGNNTDLALYEAVDKTKDQSYYLYTLSQEKLKKIIFPLGNMQKSDVYDLAKKYEISIPEWYRESQDLCFYPEKEPTAFLKRYITDIEEGDIETEDGKKVGTHKGLPFYTIGQRKGLNIGGLKIPLHVVHKDVEKNTIVVAPDGEDKKSKLSADDCYWINEQPSDSSNLSARISSLGEKRNGVLENNGSSITFTFDTPVRGIAAGQAVVLYDGEKVVGGATITNAIS